MERLTNSIDYCQLHCDFGKSIECSFSNQDNCYERSIYCKLREYENLDEQGLLFRLPCGIGTDVYFIPSKTDFKLNILNDKPQFNRVYHQNVARITFIRNGLYMECDKDLEYATGNILVDKMYKETWFLSHEEAEQKLNEMESDCNDD